MGAFPHQGRLGEMAALRRDWKNWRVEVGVIVQIRSSVYLVVCRNSILLRFAY